MIHYLKIFIPPKSLPFAPQKSLSPISISKSMMLTQKSWSFSRLNNSLIRKKNHTRLMKWMEPIVQIKGITFRVKHRFITQNKLNSKLQIKIPWIITIENMHLIYLKLSMIIIIFLSNLNYNWNNAWVSKRSKLIIFWAKLNSKIWMWSQKKRGEELV